jgi:hypothetical protein
MVGEILYEPMVKVSKAKERLYFPFITGFWPVCHTCHLYRIHFHLVFRDNQPQALDAGFFEFTLFGSEVQLVFC